MQCPVLFNPENHLQTYQFFNQKIILKALEDKSILMLNPCQNVSLRQRTATEEHIKPNCVPTNEPWRPDNQVLVYKQSTKSTTAAFQVVSTLGWGQLIP